MALFPDDMPAPAPEPSDAAFWAHCAAGRLRFQTCAECAIPRHPPTPMCPFCHATGVDWVDPGWKAEIYTYTVIHHASHEAVVGSLPYVVAVVTFPALPGVRLVTNVTGRDPAEICIGMPVSLWFDELENGMRVPRFHAGEKT